MYVAHKSYIKIQKKLAKTSKNYYEKIDLWKILDQLSVKQNNNIPIKIDYIFDTIS